MLGGFYVGLAGLVLVLLGAVMAEEKKEENETSIAIGAGLGQTARPYVFMEDVVVDVTVRNTGASSYTIPFLKNSSAFAIRLSRHDGSRSWDTTTYLPTPGVPKFVTEATGYALAGGHEVTFPLTLQDYLGTLQPGAYRLEVVLTLDHARLAPEPLDFTVLPGDVKAPSLSYTATAEADGYFITWIDQQPKTNYLLWRWYSARPGPPAIWTRVLPVPSPGQTPVVAAEALPGHRGDRTWLAWLAGSDLHYAHAAVSAVHATGRCSLRAPMALVAPALTYPDATTDEGGFELLSVSGEGGGALEAIRVDAAGRCAQATLQRLGYRPDAVAVTHLDHANRWAGWAEPVGADSTRLWLAPWNASGEFEQARQIGQHGVKVFALSMRALDGALTVAALSQTTARDAPARLVLSVDTFDLSAEGGLAATGVRTERAFAIELAEAGAATQLAADGRSTAWAVVTDIHGRRMALGTDLASPVPLDLPDAASYPLLAIRHQRPPVVLWFDATQGWFSRKVIAVD